MPVLSDKLEFYHRQRNKNDHGLSKLLNHTVYSLLLCVHIL